MNPEPKSRQLLTFAVNQSDWVSFAQLPRLNDHKDMKNPNCSSLFSQPHALAAACATLLGCLALTACVAPLTPGPPEVASGPAPSGAAPAATMKGPVLIAAGGTGSNPARPTTSTNPTNSTSAPSATSLMRDIAAEIGDASCDTDAQCHTLGVGAKACGGPDGYVAWSSKGENMGRGGGSDKASDKRARLSELAEAHSNASRAENERSGMRSNCSVTPDPGAVCLPRVRDGLRVCQTVQGRRNGAV